MVKAVLIGLMLAMAPAVWFATQNGIGDPIRLLIFSLLVLWAVSFSIFYTLSPANRSTAWMTQLQLVDLWVVALLIVAVTGWFSSPFLFLVYLLIISAYFVLSPWATVGMAVSLALVFLVPNPRSLMLNDYLTLIAITLTGPIAFYLRREYIKIGAAEKGVLVLATEPEAKDGTLSKVLANRVTQFSAKIREPLVNIRNYTHVAGNHELDQQERWDYLQKIFDSAALALKELTKFEEETTGHKMHSTTSENP